ncbi:MAG: SRPBCC family protein [Gloeomargarita sp. GMQP_bins_120]
MGGSGMGEWCEHTVQVTVDVPVSLAWALWSDLEQMPRWMQWIRSVEVLPDRPELSRWHLATRGLDFYWESRIVKQIPHQIIQWESVTGLPNRGAVRFYDRGPQCIVKLTVAYALPAWVSQWVDGLVGPHVERTLQADLERFRDYSQNLAPAALAQPLN